MHSPISKTIRSGGIDVAWSHPSEAPALPALGPNSVNWIASCFEAEACPASGLIPQNTSPAPLSRGCRPTFGSAIFVLWRRLDLGLIHTIRKAHDIL